MLLKPVCVLPVLAVLAACGGGATASDPVAYNPPAGPVPLLSEIASADQLQALGINPDGGFVASTASDMPQSGAIVGRYVLIKDISVSGQSDVVGVAAASIPTNISFTGSASAIAYIEDGNVSYNLSDGNVSGTISQSGKLSVDMTFVNGTELPEGSSAESPIVGKTFVVSLATDQSGGSCGANNLLCGGAVTASLNGSEIVNISNTNADVLVGVFGNPDEYELGGRFQGEDTTVGDFVAGQFIAAQD